MSSEKFLWPKIGAGERTTSRTWYSGRRWSETSCQSAFREGATDHNQFASVYSSLMHKRNTVIGMIESFAWKYQIEDIQNNREKSRKSDKPSCLMDTILISNIERTSFGFFFFLLLCASDITANAEITQNCCNEATVPVNATRISSASFSSRHIENGRFLNGSFPEHGPNQTRNQNAQNAIYSHQKLDRTTPNKNVKRT